MVKVGEDEFCTQCMEWCTIDAEGKCSVCGKLLKKTLSTNKTESYGEYEREDIEYNGDAGD